ncbi:MAG: hypothetical protein KKE11_05820 [Gammaproteobacteria bacterium]|nr:hypothetical protein [Gammaproteobacteria bacterium]
MPRSSKTIFHEMKSIVPILFFTVLLAFTSIVNAADDAGQVESSIIEYKPSVQQIGSSNNIKQEQVKKKSVFINDCYDFTYRFIDKYNYLLVPLYDMFVGGILCGPRGAVAGSVFGALDEGLVYFGYSDKRYMTWGLLGAAAGHMIASNARSKLAGTVLGIMLPTGVINQHSEYITPLVAPVVSAIAGNKVFGTPGLVAGGVAGTLDEISIRSGFTQKHYLTATNLGMGVAALSTYFNPTISNFIGAGLGLVAANYETMLLDSVQDPLKKVEKLYDTYDKFIPQDQLKSHFEKQAIGMVSSQFMMQLLSLKLMEHQNGISHVIELLGVRGEPLPPAIKEKVLQFAIFIVPYVIGPFIKDNINVYYDNRLKCTLQDKIKTEVYSGEVISRFKNNNGTLLLDNYQNDISLLVGAGTLFGTKAISAATQGIYGTMMLIVYSPNTLIYSTLCEQALSFVSRILASQSMSYEERITELTSEWQNNRKHDEENSNIIIEKDGLVAAKETDQRITTELRNAKGIQGVWDRLRTSWYGVELLVRFLATRSVIYNEIADKRLDFSYKSKVEVLNDQAKNLFAFPITSSLDIKSIEPALQRFIMVEGIIHLPQNFTDKINRENQYGNQLILQDLEVSEEKLILIKAEGEVRLDLGKTYAIISSDSRAISALLSKIKGIKENGIGGSGHIIYPQLNDCDPKILIFGKEYFSFDYSLQQIISYPDKIPSDLVLNALQREEMNRLLQEIEFPSITSGALNLDVIVKNWKNRLTKEEMRMLDVISAIIKKPDILILDETFDNLSENSLKRAKKMLKDRLPETLIIIVDHNAQNNNYDGFYDQELYISNRNIVVKDIKTTMH